MKRMPRDETWAALETAAVHLALGMKSQDVTNLTGAYATLGRMPRDETWGRCWRPRRCGWHRA